MKLYSYIVRWDHGFAPNPFHGVLTLATCKPAIRAKASVDDYVVGTGSAARALTGRLVFLMRVGEILTFDQYWRDNRFAAKKPVMNGSLKQRFGDNIYHRQNCAGPWLQADSRHSQMDGAPIIGNITRDTATSDKVLVANAFTYWGGQGPKLPKALSYVVHDRQFHRAWFGDDEIAAFLKWAIGRNEHGYVAPPAEWAFERWWR